MGVLCLRAAIQAALETSTSEAIVTVTKSGRGTGPKEEAGNRRG